MLHRMLGVVFAVCLVAADVGAAQVALSYADVAPFAGVGAALDYAALGTALPRSVPEPSTLALFGLGVALVGIGFVRRRSGPRRRPKP